MPEPIPYVYREERDHNERVVGSLISQNMVKETLDSDRLLYIHQPLSTNAPPGILILMDGEQEMRPGFAAKSTPEIVDELYENKKISPQVCVYIPAPQDRIREYACNEEFANFLNNKLVPLLRKPPFGCSDCREQTTIVGTSFGGLAATHAALTYPETFGNVLSQSGAFWWNEGWKGFDHPDKWTSASKTAKHETTQQAMAMKWLNEIPHKEGLSVNFYLSGGEIEENKTPSLNGESFPGATTLNNELSTRLADRGHNVTTAITSGDHDYGSWQSDKPVALQTLLPKPALQQAADHEKAKQYRDNLREMKRSDLEETSSNAETEKFTPLPTTPKPPWEK
ncbi:alpha/beta hydrolase [Fluoribacter gormanii]|uniref:Enterochelin esterase n=2 Tax=Fluoribacter gormanii TaxID=464 RepID=A0A377GHJ6_9GAMM|nr:alpha/beta hydrolase-fold protein [Fluoribacter gormanii]KTD03304.1 Enterochelin esterase [Fluoribacter gormanii]SIR72966.1 Enterochelin esterase [Fluoribacter gormanii]STO24256.1 Ferric enterobactin esterase [Fluoribacter gormanii]